MTRYMTYNNDEIRDIVTGIFLCLLILISNLSSPLIGFLTVPFLPLPVLYFRLKLGKVKGALIPAMVFLIIAIVIQALSFNLLFFGSFLLTGFLMGNFLEGHISIEKTILYTVLNTMVICFFLFCLTSLFNDKSILTIIIDFVTKLIEFSFKMYSDMGIDQKLLDELAKSSKAIINTVMMILPSIFATILMFITWFNVLVIQKILKRDGVVMSWLGILNQWKAPEYLVWLTIAALSSAFIPMEVIKMLGLNIFIVLMPIYFFQGIAVVSFYFEKKKSPVLLKFFIYTLIIIQQIFALFIVGIGFFDTWFDFRKLNLQQNLQN